MKKYLLPETGNFYKANLHCHSTVSDGRLSPEELKAAYMAKGYSIIAYTDHNIMIPHPELAEEGFLPLTGYEMDVNEQRDTSFREIKTCHMCFIALEPDNLQQVCWHREKYLFGNAVNYRDKACFDPAKPDYERVFTPECISDMMKTGRDNGFFVTYNHPTWSLEDYSDYIRYDNMNAMEICNFGCVVVGYDDYNPRVYDDMLRAGKRIFCVATDDNHNIHPLDSVDCDSFGGFTMIKAEKLEYRTITKALEAGHFYASQGPEIKELWYEDGELHVRCAPADRVEFTFGNRYAVRVSAENGVPVEHAHCKVPEDTIFVRATVTDAKGFKANTNAYFLDELNK